MPATLQPRQRAAALVLAIGSGRASHLLDYLSREEVELLADEVARLGSIGSGERAAAVREAISQLRTMDPAAEAAALRSHAGRLQLGAASAAAGRPFAFLERVDFDEAVTFLRVEHPQTAAVVLSCQPSQLAARLLAALDDELAADIALRIATLGRMPAGLLDEMDRVARRQLTGSGVAVVAPDGAKELAAILNNGNRDLESAVLERLAGHDRSLAERVRSLMFVFEDIVTLGDRAIQQVLQNVNTQSLAVALKGVTPEVRDTVFRNLSERAREALAEEIDLLGAVRRSDVAQAQTEIVAQIRMLEAAGTIVINRGDEGELVA